MILNIVEASISDLQSTLSSGATTSVELVSRYLQRISTYDARGPCLNAIPILNPDIFDEAEASDARRASGRIRGPLDGIPYTIKDSMKYKGMTCASGSEAFPDLVANEDCFVAAQLRQAGAVCVGRTNTPPMMASGMHRGAYGRAESPYNLEYLTAAFSSGSSNGSATSTAASFAAFGLGSETVSSGRSPASNNGLVAYTPSRAVISPRGCWPLYPTCDVLVPHTRTVEDMLTILDVLTVEDEDKEGNFWLEQPFVEIKRTELPESLPALMQGAETCFQGKVIGVPRMFIGGDDASALPITISRDVKELWRQTRISLEALGAIVKETDFPLVTNYDYNPETGTSNNVLGLPNNWNSIERSTLVAYSWDDFLVSNGNPEYPGLGAVDGSKLFPRPPNYIPDRFAETKNFIDYPGLVSIAQTRNRAEQSTYGIPGMAEALHALEAQRKRDLEDWMDKQGLDLVVFPANGDVGKADVDTNEESARHALLNGVKYSHGNRAIRHMGVPTVSVCMGTMEMSRMPVGLTFAGKSGADAELLRYAYAFEQKTKQRVAPPVTPALPSDAIEMSSDGALMGRQPALQLVIDAARVAEDSTVLLAGSVTKEAEAVQLEIFIDGKVLDDSAIDRLPDGKWTAQGKYRPHLAQTPLYGGVGLVVDKVMVVVLAKSKGRTAGNLRLLPQPYSKV